MKLTLFFLIILGIVIVVQAAPRKCYNSEESSEESREGSSEESCEERYDLEQSLSNDSHL